MPEECCSTASGHLATPCNLLQRRRAREGMCPERPAALQHTSWKYRGACCSDCNTLPTMVTVRALRASGGVWHCGRARCNRATRIGTFPGRALRRCRAGAGVARPFRSRDHHIPCTCHGSRCSAAALSGTKTIDPSRSCIGPRDAITGTCAASHRSIGLDRRVVAAP